MSEDFLVTQSLDDLSKEMSFCLNHNPMLAIRFEEIDHFCSTFQILFSGKYQRLSFDTTMLYNCITQYCECILMFVQDNSVSVRKDEVDYLKRWLSVLDNLGGLDSVRNKFTLFMPFVQNLICEDLPLWIIKEFLLHLNWIFEKPTLLIFRRRGKTTFFLRIVERLLQLIMTCGDYEFQTILIEAIISTCELWHMEVVLVNNFGDTNHLTRMFLQAYSKQNYVNDLKTLLTAINDSFNYVSSVPCLKVILGETVIPPIKGMYGGDIWMHINYGFRTLSFCCHQDSLRSLPGSINRSNSDEFVTVNFEDIKHICLLINNDCETVDSFGGSFLIDLTGKCSCRFDSTKEIFTLIKTITLTVSGGSHLHLLRKAFIILFGERFKQTNNMPIKERNFNDKRDSLLNLSTPNSSYRAENTKYNNAVDRKKSDPPESKRTKEQITSLPERSNEQFKNNFQEIIESCRNSSPDKNFLNDKFITCEKINKSRINKNELLDIIDKETINFEKLKEPPPSLPTKKFLLNKFNRNESKSTVSTLKTNTSMESDFEMIVTKTQLNSQELGLSPKVTLFDMIATNEKKDVTPLIGELQKSPLNKLAAKVEVQNKNMSDGEEFAKKRLSDKTATSNAEKRIKLEEDVRLIGQVHKPKEDSFSKFTLEMSPFKFNGPGESIQWHDYNSDNDTDRSHRYDAILNMLNVYLENTSREEEETQEENPRKPGSK